MTFSKTYDLLIEDLGIKLPEGLEQKVDLIAAHSVKVIEKLRRLHQQDATEKVTTIKFVDPYTNLNRMIDIEIKFDEKNKYVRRALYSPSKNKISINAANDTFEYADAAYVKQKLLHELTHSIDPKVREHLSNISNLSKKEKVSTPEEFDAYWAAIQSRLETLARTIGPRTISKKIDKWLTTTDEVVEHELFQHETSIVRIWKENLKVLKQFKDRLQEYKSYLDEMAA